MDQSGKRQELQKLLEQEMRLEKQLQELNEQIQIYEDRCFGHGWCEGNLKIGWSRGEIFKQPFSVALASKDQLFSLSSITSPASLRQTDIENANLLPFDGSRFYKKKKKTKKIRKTFNGVFHKKRRLKKNNKQSSNSVPKK